MTDVGISFAGQLEVTPVLVQLKLLPEQMPVMSNVPLHPVGLHEGCQVNVPVNVDIT
jgi:hypothetical protein